MPFETNRHYHALLMMTCFETLSKVLSKSVFMACFTFFLNSAFLRPSDVKEICNHFIKHFLLLLCHCESLCVDLKKKFGLFAENLKTLLLSENPFKVKQSFKCEDIKYKCIDKWFNV